MKNILYVLSLLTGVYFLVMLAALGLSYIFTYFWVILALGLFLAAHYLEALTALPKFVKRGAALLLAGVVLLFMGVQIFIASGAASQPLPGADYVIVLGAKVNGTVPSVRLQARIDAAAVYIEQNPGAKVIASGGQGADEGISEAQAISNSLQEKGISADSIFLEDKSTTTKENLSFSLWRMKEEGVDLRAKNVVIVSSDFHVARAGNLAKQLGYQEVSLLPDEGKSPIHFQITYYMREFVTVMLDCILKR